MAEKGHKDRATERTPDHIVISSVLVGSIISKNVYEKEKVSFWGNSDCGEFKFAVIKYYDESHLNKEDCRYSKREKPEIFFISTNDQKFYYSVDLSMLESVKVPTEEDHDMGY